MRRRITFGVLAAFAVLAAIAAVAAAVGRGHADQNAAAASRAAAEKSHAAPARIEKMIHDADGQEASGPAAEAYADRAYPAASISAERVQASHSADSSIRHRGSHR